MQIEMLSSKSNKAFFRNVISHSMSLKTWKWKIQGFRYNMRVHSHVRARLHQASASMLRQLCDDATDSAHIEINGDAWKWVANPFWSIIAELYHYIAFYLEQYLRRVADAWCKRTLIMSVAKWTTEIIVHTNMSTFLRTNFFHLASLTMITYQLYFIWNYWTFHNQYIHSRYKINFIYGRNLHKNLLHIR